MSESVGDIVRRGAIYIPPDNRKCYIKRLKTNGEYESTWQDVSTDIMQWGTINTGFSDGVYLGEFNESNLTIVFNNQTRKYNREVDPSSFFNGFKTRYKTKFKIEIYAVDNGDNDVLLRAWYGICLANPTTSSNGEMSFDVSPITKVLQMYTALGIDQTAATTQELIERLIYKIQNGTSIFSQYFEGYSINPDAISCMTITTPTIKDKETVLDKIRDYSLYQDFFYYVDNSGYFVWTNREATTSIVWELNGAGQTDSTYGTNIVSINNEYDDLDNTYSRVVIEYKTNGVVTEQTFSGLRASDDSGSLSDADSVTLFNWLKINNYLDTETYALAHIYVSGSSSLTTYLDVTWPLYKDGIIEKLNDLVKSVDGSYLKNLAWSVGDGSTADIYGEKIFSQSFDELTLAEATTVGDRIYTNYSNAKIKWEIEVFGLYQLMPKDKLVINYIGEIGVVNPFILDVSLLDGTDVLANRTGSIYINGDFAKVESISINLDNFDIILVVKEI